MGTFQRKETVDARQFTGGPSNGLEVAFWVNSNGQQLDTRAAYYPEVRRVDLEHRPERILIKGFGIRSYAYLNDWVILRQDGTFDHMRDEDFKASGFEQV